jgi:hypothetical protein
VCARTNFLRQEEIHLETLRAWIGAE